MDSKFEKVKQLLDKYGQQQLLVYYNKLSDREKEKLLDQILTLDFELINSLFELTKRPIDLGNDKIEPIEYVEKNKIEPKTYEELEEKGVKKIKEGKLAIVTMAGGQGTRLGHDGPKGTFDLGLESKKSIFEILCDKLKEAYNKYKVYITWYLMTSNENNQSTIKFFEENNYFNYPKEKIKFFIQGELPMIDTAGKVLVDQSGFVKLAANGHGGVFESMLTSNVLEDLKKDNIEWIFIGGVDNVLVKMVDPLFIGLAESKNCLAAGKSVVKANPEEKVGVFCMRNNKPSVIEYSEITNEMANQKNQDGQLVYGETHLLCNLFNIQIIEKISKNKLPYHVAFKKASYINEKGELVEPEQPNSYKFETFIFDAFSSIANMAILRVKREEEFAPVKNKEGVDSPETARELYKNFYGIS